jgi:lipopolysaccharide transport system permease protein
MILFLAMMAYFGWRGNEFQPNGWILIFPLLLLLMAMLGLGIGMIISALTTKYRDLSFLLTFGIQLLMYATTVIYPLSAVKEKYPEYQWVIEYNPMTAIIESFRYGFLGEGSFTVLGLVITSLITIVLFFIGLVIFNKVERTFIDTV